MIILAECLGTEVTNVNENIALSQVAGGLGADLSLQLGGENTVSFDGGFVPFFGDDSIDVHVSL